MHLIEAHFKDNAERRRIEYLLKKYKGQVKRSDGVAIIVLDDEILTTFLQELRSKLEDDEIAVYEMQSTDLELSPETVHIKMEFEQKPHSVNAFMGYFVSKRQGELMKQLPGFHRWYRIMTRKGKVDLEVEVKADRKTRLRVELEGFDPALRMITQELEKDLEHFKDGG